MMLKKKCSICGKEFMSGCKTINLCAICYNDINANPVTPSKTPPGIINAPRFDTEYFKAGDAFEMDLGTSKHNIIIVERRNEMLKTISSSFGTGGIMICDYLSGEVKLRKLS